MRNAERLGKMDSSDQLMPVFSTACLASSPKFQKELEMLGSNVGLGSALIIIALIAGLFGFSGIGNVPWEGARIFFFFFFFIVLALLAFVGAIFFRIADHYEE